MCLLDRVVLALESQLDRGKVEVKREHRRL